MKVTRGQIIVFCMVAGIVGGTYAVWVFALEERFALYAENAQQLEAYRSSFERLESSFGGVTPDSLLNRIREATPAWEQALDERGAYFDASEWIEIEQPPEELLRFWYEETTDQMVLDFATEVFETNPNFLFPENANVRQIVYEGLFREQLGVPTFDELRGQSVNSENVSTWMRELSFGISLYQFLVDNGVFQVQELSVGEDQRPQVLGRLLFTRTVGVKLRTTLDNLVDMLNELREADRWFHVDGMRISQPFIAQRGGPPVLNVEMLLTQASYVPRPDEERTGGAAGLSMAALQQQGAPARRTAAAQEPSAISQWWTWFRRNVLYMP